MEQLSRVFSGLVDYYGAKQFERSAPISLPAAALSFPAEQREELIQDLAEEMAEAAGIRAKIQLQIFEHEAEVSFENGMEIVRNVSGNFTGIKKGRASIGISREKVWDQAERPAILAHELAHVFLHLRRPPKKLFGAGDEERLTDLTAIALGFGVYICNTQERVAESHVYRTSGYLSLEECCFVQALVSFRFKQSFRDFQLDLHRRPRELVGRALQELSL